MITILGASGRVGSKTTEILLNEGQSLRLIARHADRLAPFGLRGAEIKAGDISDADFLSEALKGSDVVFTMIPSDYSSPDVHAFQNRMGEAQIEAVRRSGVKRVLNLSSLGGHTEENTGIVAGLARQEIRWNALEDVHVKTLRPAYFMENTMQMIGIIKGMNITGDALKAETSLPMIATRDIARVAANYLMNANWTGKSVHSLLGPKNYTMKEVSRVLSEAVNKPGLPFIEFPYEQAKEAMIQHGMSESASNEMIGLIRGINTGVFNSIERNAESTTPTSIEEFAKEFALAYGN